MKNFSISKGPYTITTDPEKMDTDLIHHYLSTQSYWAQERTREQNLKGFANSLCFGLFYGGKQIGFARVITDFAVFAYLADVFILEEYRGKGLSKWLMEIITTFPELQGLRRWMLGTRDAHTLYEKYGFKPLQEPGRWMEKRSEH